MSMLDVIPYSLFRMLCSPTRTRNVAVLEQLYAQFFDDYSGAPRKAEVLHVIRQVLRNPDYAHIAEDGEGASPEVADSIVYNKLREDGWIMEVLNRRITEVHMPRDAHALLSMLLSLQDELKVNISAQASLIDTGVISAYDDPVNKVMNIASARKQAIQLRRSIDGILTSLHRIEEDLMQSEGLADLLAKFMERFVEKLLLDNYRALKASAYNPMRFQRSIRSNTEHFINDRGQIMRAAAALVDQGLARDIAAAETEILQDLSKIRDVFIGLGEKLDLIERFSHRLERRIATTVRYQETARNLKEESLRAAIRSAFAALDRGETTCITPLVQAPVPYSDATLATPRKAREAVVPEERRFKVVDPSDVKREELVDAYAAHMTVTPAVVAAFLKSFATTDQFVDLASFTPESAQDLAILYEVRAGTMGEFPGIEIRTMPGFTEGRFISGPSTLVRRTGAER